MSNGDGAGGPGLRVLVVDDEPPALSELEYLLGLDPRVGCIRTAGDATEALRMLESTAVDVILTDINMPGLDGIALAKVVARFARRPHVVFVTAHDQHAVEAFDLAATDFIMKPVRAERLAEAIGRCTAVRAAAPRTPTNDSGETIPVELGGVTRFLNRDDVRYATAQGDYTRLHTAGGSHLVRIPLSVLEERWSGAGFVRIHRSTLVSLARVEELRVEHGKCSVVVDGVVLQVSRRHTRELRDRLVRASRLTPG